MYGSKIDNIEVRFQQACDLYRRLIFNGAAPEVIRHAAIDVYRYSGGLVLKAETMH